MDNYLPIVSSVNQGLNQIWPWKIPRRPSLMETHIKHREIFIECTNTPQTVKDHETPKTREEIQRAIEKIFSSKAWIKQKLSEEKLQQKKIHILILSPPHDTLACTLDLSNLTIHLDSTMDQENLYQIKMRSSKTQNHITLLIIAKRVHQLWFFFLEQAQIPNTAPANANGAIPPITLPIQEENATREIAENSNTISPSHIEFQKK